MKIITALDYMFRGLVVGISPELRKTVRGSDIGEVFFIKAINDNQTLELRGMKTGWEFSGVKLEEINF